jgi:hypothetical protein
LTIDAGIQQELEASMQQHCEVHSAMTKRVWGAVMEVSTGKILLPGDRRRHSIRMYREIDGIQ